jgi:hypothetical protein
VSSSKPKYVIKTSDIESPQVDNLVDHLQRAKDIPLVRQVGEAKASKDGVITIAVLVGAGIISGGVVWLLSNLVPDDAETMTANLAFSFILTIGIALVLVAADASLSRSIVKLGKSLAYAAPTAVVSALVLGLLVNSLYSSMSEATFNSLVNSGLDPATDSFWEAYRNRNHLNRGLAWSFVGVSAGLAVGIPSLAVKRIGITAAGGFVGGFIGGFLFDFFVGETEAQIAGFAVTGAAIGLSVSLLEQVAKSSWLEIIKGGMAGKQFIIYQNQITVGSSPSANVTLIKDPAIAGIAATIKRFGSSVTISAVDRSIPINVNGVSAFEHRLVEGAVIVLGSTEIRFREKSKKINDSGIVRG